MYYRKDYGIGDLMREDPKIPKNEYVAIPYSGVDSPVNGSEFSDPYLTLILTVISYVYRGLTKDNVLELINSYYLMNWKRTGFKDYVLNKVVNYEPSQLKMKLATGMWDFKLDDHDYNILKVKKECIVDFLMNIVIKNYIDVAENQYNCSFVDIINRRFCQKRTGFSGTTNILLPYIISDTDAQENAQKYDKCITDVTIVLIFSNIDVIFDNNVH